MELTSLTLVVLMANFLGAAMAMPQARKLLRTRQVAGVSLTWAAVSIAVNAGWAIYGVAVAELAIVPVSIISVGSYAVIGATVVRCSATPARQLVAGAAPATFAVTAIPVLALLVGGWSTAGIALGALYGVQLSPAVVAVYRAADVSGVSIATWVIAFAEAALWGIYGWAGIDVGLLTLAGTGVVMSSLVLARLLLGRARHAHLVQSPSLGGLATA